MAFVKPPSSYTGPPNTLVLPAGTELWRVHRRTRSSTEFNATATHRYFGGGRFDATADDLYPYSYVGSTDVVAVAERFVRGMAVDDDGYRYLARALLRERRLSVLEATGDLTLISLMNAEDLAAAAQDEWLIHAEGKEYAQTRHWAHWLRSVAPSAHGLIWPSKRDAGSWAAMLFGDRCKPSMLRPGSTQLDLDTPGGIRWLNAALRGRRVMVR